MSSVCHNRTTKCARVHVQHRNAPNKKRKSEGNRLELISTCAGRPGRGLKGRGGRAPTAEPAHRDTRILARLLVRHSNERSKMMRGNRELPIWVLYPESSPTEAPPLPSRASNITQNCTWGFREFDDPTRLASSPLGFSSPSASVSASPWERIQPDQHGEGMLSRPRPRWGQLQQ